MRELTVRQQEVLAFFKGYTQTHGMPPTVREVGTALKVTPRAAHDFLKALERKGNLEHLDGPRRSRAFRLAPRPVERIDL